MADRHQDFASDNYSGMCPEAWAALAEANSGHAPAYGEDRWTSRAADAFRRLFETDCEVFFVFNGTASNALALAALCQSYHAVICSDQAHVDTAECGAPEFFSGGSKLIVAPTPDGKLTGDIVRKFGGGRRELHYPKPRAVTITQSTETGLVYDAGEIADVAAACRHFGLRLHMDGARFANACASPAAAAAGATPADLSWRAGVDVLCFGGTKNGMAFGEAVVFFDRALAADFDYRCKQAGQLASKMRFLAAPWSGLLESGAWLRNAAHANASTRHLAAHLADIPGLAPISPVEANAIFVRAPDALLDKVRAKGWRFYTFDDGTTRFMCGWDADIAQIDAFAADLREAAFARAA